MSDASPSANWAERHRRIADAATALFLEKGYLGTSMDDIAAAAAVSKQTVYKHFSDKDQLFAEIVVATIGQLDGLVRMVGTALETTTDLRDDLGELARRLLTTLMQPQLGQLRRLVISTADLFPEVGRSWYELGFERVFRTIATYFSQLTDRGLLRADDPLLAANHFVGLLMWTPMARALFTGDETSRKRELHGYADAATDAFLRAYGSHDLFDTPPVDKAMTAGDDHPWRGSEAAPTRSR